MSSSTAIASSASTTKERSGLALLAGVLAVPGSTLAWDLPHGGFWIGLPLAIVAIGLGLMSYSQVGGRRRGMAIAAVVLGVAAVLFIVGCTVFA
jgi:hypothetical protein